MSKIVSYPSGTLRLSDYLIGTDRESSNVTRSFLVSEVVNTILAAVGAGTVTSISTVSSTFISVTGGPITTTGTVAADISATGTKNQTTFLRGDNTWSLPGPAPNTVSILYNGTTLTSEVSSIDYIGGGTASAANLSVRLFVPGSGSLVDNAIAGTAISVSAPTGSVTVTNDGVITAQAGGNITLSGGTGNVTVSSTANPVSLTSISAGEGITTVTNASTNPEIDLNFTSINNYLLTSQAVTLSTPSDSIEFNQISSSSVKAVEIGQIPIGVLTAVDKYIDDADENTLKNTTDTFTSSQKTRNMVSLTVAEHAALVSGGTVDENTLYFLLGALPTFTANAVRTNLIGTGDYTLSTSPTSVTGVVGTPYSFVTTISVNTGTYTPGNINPTLTVSGNIVNNLGTSYSVPFNATGSWAGPPISTGQAELAVNLAAGSGGGTSIATAGFSSIWEYVAGKSIPLDLNPIPTNTSGNYSFNTEIQITTASAASYEFSSPVLYENIYNSTNYTATPGFSGSIPTGTSNPITTRAHGIQASYRLKQFLYTLIQADNIIDSNGAAGGAGENVEYTLSFTGTASGTYNYGTSITGTLTATTIGNFEFTTGNTTSRTATFTGFTLVAAASKTLTLTGTLQNTTTQPQYRELDATAAITARITGAASSYTISNAAQGPFSGANGNLEYLLPTVNPATGYYLTGGVVTLSENPVEYNVSLWGPNNASTDGLGTSASPAIENDPTTTLGTVALSAATIRVECVALPVTSSITYQTSFATGISSAVTLTTTDTQNVTNPTPFSIGNGNITVSVIRTSPSNTAQRPGLIVWYLDNVQQGTSQAFNVGDGISYNKTINGVINGQTLLATISEKSQYRELIATTEMNNAMGAATQYTLSNDSQTTNSVGNVTGAHTYTTPTIVPNNGYQLTGGVVSLSNVGTNGTVTFFSSLWAPSNASTDGTGETSGDPAIENTVTVTTGTLTTETRKLDVTAYVATQITGTEYTISNASQTINSANLITYEYTVPTVIPNADYTLTDGVISLPYNPITFFVTGSQSGTGTAIDPLIENNPTVTPGTVICIPYTITLSYANSISGGTEGVEYTLSPADGNTRVGCVGTAYSFGTITATPASGYYFSTPFNASQTSLSLPIIGTMPSGGGTASQNLTGVIALARATIEVVQVAVPTTTAITYATSFAPGGSGATRTLTTTGTQTLSNSAYEYGNGSITVTVNRTAPSSTAQDSGYIYWILNGTTQSSQQIYNGTTISYSRTITGVTAGDTIQVTIDEG